MLNSGRDRAQRRVFPAERLRAAWGETFSMQILGDTSPEQAIKVAYDFGRDLRDAGADTGDLPRLLGQWVEEPYRNHGLLRYIRAGFVAGFRHDPLPWRRQIDAPRN